uniref:Uncharacterized protein n=1 Tax=Glossina austeni TaxID=7395 RepID=A0A1A9V363_GLOAU
MWRDSKTTASHPRLLHGIYDAFVVLKLSNMREQFEDEKEYYFQQDGKPFQYHSDERVNLNENAKGCHRIAPAFSGSSATILMFETIRENICPYSVPLCYWYANVFTFFVVADNI